jgi:hypothetical protein
MPALLVFWLMAVPVSLSLFDAISPIIGYAVITVLGAGRQVRNLATSLPAATSSLVIS